MTKHRLVLDFETGSECDISAEGGWRYSKHPSTRVYCLAYTIDNQAPKVWLPPKEAVRYLFNVRATHKGLTGHFSRVKGKSKKTTKKRLEEIKKQESVRFTWPERFENLIEGKGIARRGWNWEGPSILPVWAGYKIKWRPDFLNLPLDSLTFEAHNAFFEKSVWENICVPKLGFPKVRDEAWECSAALASYYALPRALDKVGDALDLPVKKDMEGKMAMMQLAKPKPGGSFEISPHKFSTLFSYCVDDVRAEREISRRLPALSPYERRVWLLDQKINRNGVPLDQEVIDGAIKIIEGYTKILEAEMAEITGGRLNNIRQTATLQSWLGDNGVFVDNVQKGTIEEVLSRTNIKPSVRRVLEIRQALGQTSTAKYYALRNYCDVDNTAKDQFMYCGASTLRFSGKGAQWQNFPRGSLTPTEDMFEAIKSGSWRQVQVFGDVMDVLSSCLRGVAAAPDGFVFYDSDFANIEGRVLAWVTGETWKLDAFREFDTFVLDENGNRIPINKKGEIVPLGEHDDFLRKGSDLYVKAYSKAFGVPEKEVSKDQRQVGKTMELACFGPETQVLTNTGYKSIMDISSTDLVWDGVEWVRTDGVVSKGTREVMNLNGVEVTPDHEVLVKDEWMSAKTVGSSRKRLSQALETGSVNLPSWVFSENLPEDCTESKCNVLAEPSHIKSLGVICDEAEAQDVTFVPKPSPDTGGRSTGGMQISSLTPTTDVGSLIEYPRAYLDAEIPSSLETRTMPEEALKFKILGQKEKKVEEDSCDTSSHYRDGTIPSWSSTESTTTEGTRKGISDSSLKEITFETGELCLKCNHESMNLRPVYDIMNAGPRNRFTIKTDSGHLIVHNCGYQGAVGAFQKMAVTLGVTLPEAQVIEIVKLWRAAHPKVVAFWKAVEEAAMKAVATGREIKVNDKISFVVEDDFLVCKTAAGSEMHYYKPAISEIDSPWGKRNALTFMGVNSTTKKFERQDTYGGKLCLAKGTLVVTDNGPKPIEEVALRDRVWDGDKWVSHAGLLYKGKSAIIDAYGVNMTPDHKVLTEEGWKSASQSKGYNRAGCRIPEGYAVRWLGRNKVYMGGRVHGVREGGESACHRADQNAQKRGSSLLWVHERGDHIPTTHLPRKVGTPPVRSLEINAGSLSPTLSPIVGELRGARDIRMPSVAGIIRKLLGRHVPELFSRINVGPNRQRKRVLPRELPVENVHPASREPEEHRVDPSGERASYNEGVFPEVRGEAKHDTFSLISRTGVPGACGTPEEVDVYDLLDCGDLHRFTVLGKDGGLLIVHNCENIVQHLARIVLTDTMLDLDEAGFDIRLHIHDQIVALVPENDQKLTVELYESLMVKPKEWAKDLPLAAEGEILKRFKKG